MQVKLDRTHDANARSWVHTANDPDIDFPIQNLPFGRLRDKESGRPRVVVAIGDRALDVLSVARACAFGGLAAEAAEACANGDLNPLIALSPLHARSLRAAIFDALSEMTPDANRAPSSALSPIADADMLLPMKIGDYTDFFCSMHHAVNASRIFNRPVPLQPNYHFLPVGYHGRASSVVVSGTPVLRPKGQLPPARPGEAPVYAACRMLDYEVELGIVVRGGNALGETVPIDQAADMIFGVCLQNDWSARDIQRWENLPLGPFLAKSFATTISPWIVTSEALLPFLAERAARDESMPPPPPHLVPRQGGDQTWPIEIACAIETVEMRSEGKAAETITLSRFTDMHWSASQMVAHHASNGCNLRAGDLLGSGTISGPEADSLGCLLELTEDGQKPINVGGRPHRYLDDGTRVIMTGRCRAPSARSIGLGVCEGHILPPR
ncbi:MAG: fumarylacetoacetase [Mesorhizobium sp.]|nr:fumarylacetoacetase [Mesorhizobium sp.]MCO5161245.1 fumarylacetoacetase [Mesorhizobium sp.]